MCLMRGVFIFLEHKFYNLYKEGTILHESKISGYFFTKLKLQVVYYKKSILRGILL